MAFDEGTPIVATTLLSWEPLSEAVSSFPWQQYGLTALEAQVPADKKQKKLPFHRVTECAVGLPICSSFDLHVIFSITTGTTCSHL